MKGEKFPLILFLEELVKNQYELFTVKYLDCYPQMIIVHQTHTHTLLFMPCVPSHPLAAYRKREGGPEVTSRRSAGRIRWGGVRAAVAAHEQVPGPPQGAMLG